jgi:hypothetical protein
VHSHLGAQNTNTFSHRVNLATTARSEQIVIITLKKAG